MQISRKISTARGIHHRKINSYNKGKNKRPISSVKKTKNVQPLLEVFAAHVAISRVKKREGPNDTKNPPKMQNKLRIRQYIEIPNISK
jgi:hypothetical protein